MAEIVSDKYRKVVYSGGAMYNCNLIINNQKIAPSQIQSIVISSPIVDTTAENFYVGSFVSQKLTITFKNLAEINVVSGDEVSLSIGLKVDDNNEIINIGNYIVDNITADYYKKNKLVCLDYGIKFMPAINYSEALQQSYLLTTDTVLAENKTYYVQTNNGYEKVANPVVEDIATYYENGVITLEGLLIWLCNRVGVKLGTYPTINNDIRTSSIDSRVGGKQYVSWIAEMFGGNAKINRNGVLNIIPLKQEPVYTVKALSSKSFEIGEKYHISGVRYNDGIRLFESGSEDNNVLSIRSNNPFVTSQQNIEEIYNEVKDFEIYSIKNENYGDISLDAWDIITFSVGDLLFNTYNHNEITYELVIMTKIDTKIPTKQQESSVKNIGNVEDMVRKVYTEIDNITQSINLVSANTYNKTEIQRMADGTFEEVKVHHIENQMGKFTDEGLRIQTEDPTSNPSDPKIVSDTTALFNDVGVTVKKVNHSTGKVENGKPILFSGYVNADNEDYKDEYEGQSITASQNIVVEKFAVFGAYSRIEDYTEDGISKTGMFPLGGE